MSEAEERADIASFIDQLFILHSVVEQCFYNVPKELHNDEIKKYLFEMEHKIDDVTVELARKYNGEYDVERYHIGDDEDE